MKGSRNMKKEILKVLFKPLTVLNTIMRKDERLIFFYSNLGFRDNVKAFYDYLIENNYNKDFKIVVSINDVEQHKDNAPDNVKFVNNKQGIRWFMKAKYAFYCFGKYPIKPSKSQKVINLWHGTPLKNIGNLESGCEKIDYDFFTNVVTNSPMYVPIMASIFGCDESKVVVTGYPRNDEMFRKNKIADNYIRRKAGKVILWLPTYREYDEGFVISILDKDKMHQLNEYLFKNNINMLIKLHPLQSAATEGIRFSNIKFITQDELNKANMTVYTLLRNADGLITDYSSVYFDYMLLDRPIGFAVEDMEVYKGKRGFIFENPKEFMPGPEIKNMTDVIEFIEGVRLEKDEYKEARKNVNNKVNFYQDGESCHRIVVGFFEAMID